MLRVGKIAGAHGLRGGLVVYSYTRPPEGLAQYAEWWIGPSAEAARAYRVREVRLHPKRLIAFLEGVEDRTQAEQLKGAGIFIPRSLVRVAEDEWLWADLVGLQVRTKDGFALGKVVRLAHFGAQDILIVHGTNRQGIAGEWMIPFTQDVILDVDLADGIITIELLEGLEACFTASF